MKKLQIRHWLRQLQNTSTKSISCSKVFARSVAIRRRGECPILEPSAPTTVYPVKVWFINPTKSGDDTLFQIN